MSPEDKPPAAEPLTFNVKSAEFETPSKVNVNRFVPVAEKSVPNVDVYSFELVVQNNMHFDSLRTSAAPGSFIGVTVRNP